MIISKLDGVVNLDEKPRYAWTRVGKIISARDLGEKFHLPLFVDTGAVARTSDVFESLPNVFRLYGEDLALEVLHQEYGRLKALGSWQGQIQTTPGILNTEIKGDFLLSTNRGSNRNGHYQREIGSANDYYRRAHENLLRCQGLTPKIKKKIDLVNRFRFGFVRKINTTKHAYDDEIRARYVEKNNESRTYRLRKSKKLGHLGDHDLDLYLSVSTFGDRTFEDDRILPSKLLLTSDIGFCRQPLVDRLNSNSKDLTFYEPPCVGFIRQFEETGLSSILIYKYKRVK